MQTYLNVKLTKTIDGIDYYEYPLNTTYAISKDGDVYNLDKCFKLKSSITQGTCYYTVSINNKRTKLHRMLATTFIINADNKALVDHISRNTLDNRLENLRWCTVSENAQNRKSCVDSSSKYIGVHKYITRHGKICYKAQIFKTHLGTFKIEIDAAKAYNEKAKELGVISYNII